MAIVTGDISEQTCRKDALNGDMEHPSNVADCIVLTWTADGSHSCFWFGYSQADRMVCAALC